MADVATVAKLHQHECGDDGPRLHAEVKAHRWVGLKAEAVDYTSSCGHVWEHGDENFGNFESHACPSCGKGPWLYKRRLYLDKEKH